MGRPFCLRASVLTLAIFLAARSAFAIDCNENGVDDTQDIAAATSSDCDGNGTPDECQIKFNSTAAGGPYFCVAGCDRDCNASGVPDACELANNDCNANGVPDDCEVRDRLVGTTNALALEIEPTTAIAAPFSGRGLLAPPGISGLAYDPDTRTVYGTDTYRNDLIILNLSTGEQKVVGPLGFATVNDLTFDSKSKRLYGLSGRHLLLSIDPNTGKGQAIANLPISLRSIEFDPIQLRLLGSGYYGGLLSIEPSTGAIQSTISESTPAADGLAYDVENNILYGVGGSVASSGALECISLLRIDPATGEARTLSAMRFAAAREILFDPDASLLYGADPISRTVIAIDPVSADGRIGPLDGDVLSLAFDPSAEILFGLTSEATLIRIDPQTSVQVVIGQLGFDDVFRIAFDPVAEVLYALDLEGDQLLQIDRESGAASVVGPLGMRTSAPLAFDPVENVLYGLSRPYDAVPPYLIRIDPESGAATLIGNVAFWSTGDFEFDGATGRLYGTRGAHCSELVRIDVPSGAAEVIGLSGFDRRINGLAVDSATGTWFGTDTRHDELVMLGAWLGAGTPVASTGMTAHGLAWDTNQNILYGIDKWTGRLAQIDLTDKTVHVIGSVGFKDVQDIVFDPALNVLYGADVDSDCLLVINPLDATASAIGNLGFADVRGLAFDPDSRVLFGADVATNQLVTINLQSGIGTSVAPFGQDITALAFDQSTGKLYGTSDGRELVAIDPTTAAELESLILPLSSVHSLVVHPGEGILYSAGDAGLYSTSLTNGRTRALGRTGVQYVQGLAHDSNASRLWAIGRDAIGRRFLWSLDAVTGEGTSIGPMNDGNIYGLGFDPRRNALYTVDGTLLGIRPIDMETVTVGAPIESGQSVASNVLDFNLVDGLLYAIDVFGLILSIAPDTGEVTISGELGVLGASLADIAIESRGERIHTVGSFVFVPNGPWVGNLLASVVPDTGDLDVAGSLSYPSVQGLAFINADCNENGIPDECEGDVNSNGILDACEVPSCGNGIVEFGEECDSGSANSDSLPNACRTDCSLARCGDGVVDSGEECDGASDDVCPRRCGANCSCVEVIPTTSHWGMTALALLLLIMLKITAIRQRRAAA